MELAEKGNAMGPMFGAICRDGALALKEIGLRPGAEILDVGTGSGNFAVFLAMQGYDVLTGEPDTDTSRYARQAWEEKARETGVADRIRFEPFDASEMPFAAGMFDAVFFFGVLHHVGEDIRRDVFGEALRVVRFGGAAVFFEPTSRTLEKIRVDDPDHPDAALPSNYRPGPMIDETMLSGEMMDIFVYRKSRTR